MPKELIVNVLKSFKNLTDVQANSLLELMKKKKPLSKKDIDTILNEQGCCAGNSSYTIRKELERKKVLLRVPGKEELYETVHPDRLATECKEAVTKLELEIHDLVTSEEFEGLDPRKKNKMLEEEHHIINELCKYKRDKSYTLQFFCQQKDKALPFWHEIETQFRLRPTSSILSYVLLANKVKPDDSAIIILSKRATKDGKLNYYGNLILDTELVNVFNAKRGVKK